MTAKRIPIEKFLPLYLKAAEQGLTKEEFAKTIGLKPATVYQRVYEMRANGADIPMLRSTGRLPLKARIEAILEDYNGKAKPKTKTAPAKKEPEEQVDEEMTESDPLADILG